MEPTLDVGQRVLVNRVSTRLGGDPELGDVVVFHPPDGRRQRQRSCGVAEGTPGEPCPEPTPEMADENFIKRVVAGPGDTLSIEDGIPIVNGEPFEGDWDIRPCRGVGGCDFPTEITIPDGPLLHDGRQPWRQRRQPLLGPGAPRLDHRRGLLHLLAARTGSASSSDDEDPDARPTSGAARSSSWS